MIIILPYPDKSLSPNRRNGSHWGKTKVAKDAAYEMGYYTTLQIKGKWVKSTETLHITITFVQADKRHRDLDNLLAASKPALDGIAKALGVDDRCFEPITIQRAYHKGNSSTVVEIK